MADCFRLRRNSSSVSWCVLDDVHVSLFVLLLLRAGDGALFDSRRLAGVRWIRRLLSLDVLSFVVAVITEFISRLLVCELVKSSSGSHVMVLSLLFSVSLAYDIDRARYTFRIDLFLHSSFPYTWYMYVCIYSMKSSRMICKMFLSYVLIMDKLRNNYEII